MKKRKEKKGIEQKEREKKKEKVEKKKTNKKTIRMEKNKKEYSINISSFATNPIIFLSLYMFTMMV